MPVLGATVAISAIYHWLPYYSKICDFSNISAILSPAKTGALLILIFTVLINF
jgi:hypothetical protein